MGDTWLSTKDAALMLGVSQRTVQNWVDDGKIESSRTAGGHRRLAKSTILNFVESHNLQSRFQDNVIHNSIQSDTDLPALRVLVVEDDYNILRLCELNFAQFSIPHQLYIATNGYLGLYLVGKYQPHVIFTDLKMPDLNGFQMIKEINKIPEMSACKIVAMTGLEAKEIMKMGALPEGLTILPKPIPFNTVETLLYQHAQKLNLSLPTL